MLTCVFIFATVFSSCSFLSSSITYYDPTTYKNLTDLKPHATMLYQSFAADTIDTQEIRYIRLTIAQMLEYEKGKGDKNSETAAQLKIIRTTFEEDVQHRMKNGKWGPAQTENQIENIADAFDIAITTERLKNKNQ